MTAAHSSFCVGDLTRPHIEREGDCACCCGRCQDGDLCTCVDCNGGCGCEHRAAATAYPCALCDAPLYVADSVNGGIITVNVDGHGRAAHRECPSDNARPNVDELLGIDPGWTGGMGVDDYIAHQRRDRYAD